ncbi:FAD-dependent monooxygenase [Halomonas sp. EF61]|uniref:FAD-dependent monooxygenase n=1 Tax=Halomonas sp. EF61 TaxID=2950869 RepID=UPI0032DEC999
MRPAGRDATESLYFTYPRYPFVTPVELKGDAPCHSVVIVGGGPVGMTAALELARHGVASVVLDDKDTVNDGSRAICLSRHSLEIFQQLGVESPFVDKGLGWTCGRTYYRDREILRFEMPHSDDERFAPMINLQQQYIEHFLIDAAEQNPLIELRWQSAVASLVQHDHEVILGVETPQGRYSMRADYVLAADGARSLVRRALGLKLHGEAYEGRYVIADIRMASSFPTERRALFHCSGLPETTVLIHRQPDNIWRIDYQLQDGEDAEAAVAEEVIRERVGRIVASLGEDTGWELEWWSLYKAHTLALDDYRHGRVLFIGDSAHLVPIFGVRGLNNGLADAANAGWKLAQMIQGYADESLLDSYSPERRGATLDVFANAGKSTRFMTPPTPGCRRLRDAALSLALDHDYVREFANPRQVTPYTYADSPLTQGDVDHWTRGPAPGSPLTNLRLAKDDFLLDHLGRGFTLVWFSPERAQIAQLGQILATGDGRPMLDVLAIHAGSTSPSAPATFQPGTTVSRWLLDRGGRLSAAYDATPGSLYLVRPDRHVVGRWRHLDVQAVMAAWDRALGRKVDSAGADARAQAPLTPPQPAAAAIDPPRLPFADLERVYDRLAESLDARPAGEQADLLTRLALALAHRTSSLDDALAAIAEAEAAGTGGLDR